MTVTLPRPDLIVVEGMIPAGGGTLLRAAQVADPPAFARTLLIEALGRAGVTTDAVPLGPNPAAQGDFAGLVEIGGGRRLSLVHTSSLVSIWVATSRGSMPTPIPRRSLASCSSTLDPTVCST